MKKIVYILMAMLMVSIVSALPYRPTCVDPGTLTNTPWAVTDWWPDGESSYDWRGREFINGNYTLCYQDETTLYIQYDWGLTSGKPFRNFEEIYATNIGGQSNAIKAERGFNLTFEYYYPSDNGTCLNEHPELFYQPGQIMQTIFFNNLDVAQVSAGSRFEDARYDLITGLECDVWHSFEQSSFDFESLFGEVNGVNRLVSFNLEATNVYIRNVSITYGQNMEKVFKIY